MGEAFFVTHSDAIISSGDGDCAHLIGPDVIPQGASKHRRVIAVPVEKVTPVFEQGSNDICLKIIPHSLEKSVKSNFLSGHQLCCQWSKVGPDNFDSW